MRCPRGLPTGGGAAGGGAAALGPNGLAVVVPQSPTKLATAAAKGLAKTCGECTELVLKLQFCRASATLVTQLQSALNTLQQQYSAVQAFADAKINDMDQYEPYKQRTDQILAYYQDVKQYANALVNVQKKQGMTDGEGK
jgi:hypothetical protein